MSTRRTRRTAATAEATEEVITVETRSKRTRAAPRKAASKPTSSSSKAQTSESTPKTRANAPSTTRSSASTPAPATNKRRLRSTTEAASPLRTLDEEPNKRQRTTSRKVSTPAPAQSQPIQEEDEEETPIFFTKTFDHIASQLRDFFLEESLAKSEAARSAQRTEINSLRAERDILCAERDSLRAELSCALARIVELENASHDATDLKTSPITTNPSIPEFDSFDVDQPKPAKAAFMTGDESAMELLRHVQEASKVPIPNPTTPPAEARTSPVPSSPAPVDLEETSTPSRSIFSSFTTPFTALKNLFGSSTQASPSPTRSRRPPADTVTEVLSIPPTPIGERPKRPTKKAKKPNRIVKALLQGIEQQDTDKATTWAKQIAAELQKDTTSGDKRKRLETPVLFRDLKHLPSSKPWQSGFSFPEDVLDLEDDDVVPAWAVYTSMVEEELRETKKAKTVHATSADDDMPASLNEIFGTSTASELDFQPRRSIDPSPMFETPLHHREGVNVFKELHGHDAATSDRENLQRELKAESSQLQKEVETHTPNNTEGLQRAHDPIHGSFSVPDSDSEDEEEVPAQPVWTQAPPPAPTPSHVSLPPTTHHEVERQRQKLMKHTPHKPSRLQQVSYPSPSLMSDAGDSPLKVAEIFGEIPDVEPLVFDDAELDAALAAISTSEGLQAKLSAMHWSMPTTTYDSEEEELSPI